MKKWYEDIVNGNAFKKFEELDWDNLTSEEREKHAKELKRLRDIRNVIDTARQEGYKKGLLSIKQNSK